MSEFRLDGKVAIVTGATQGIGKAIALELASHGAYVVGSARNPGSAEQVSELARQSGGAFHFVQADVTRWEDCKRTADEALSAYGHIHILINNVGIARPHKLQCEIEESDWQAVVGPTLEGTVAMTRHVLPTMIAQRDGVILNIATAAGALGLASMGAYCMAKAAVIQHARVVAVENAAHGVRANALLVGPVETEAMRKSVISQNKKAYGEDWESDAAGDEAAVFKNAMKPEQVAKAALLLCLEGAREFTGGALSMDRGISAGLFTSNHIQHLAAGILPE